MEEMASVSAHAALSPGKSAYLPGHRGDFSGDGLAPGKSSCLPRACRDLPGSRCVSREVGAAPGKSRCLQGTRARFQASRARA